MGCAFLIKRSLKQAYRDLPAVFKSKLQHVQEFRVLCNSEFFFLRCCFAKLQKHASWLACCCQKCETTQGVGYSSLSWNSCWCFCTSVKKKEAGVNEETLWSEIKLGILKIVVNIQFSYFFCFLFVRVSYQLVVISVLLCPVVFWTFVMYAYSFCNF